MFCSGCSFSSHYSVKQSISRLRHKWTVEFDVQDSMWMDERTTMLKNLNVTAKSYNSSTKWSTLKICASNVIDQAGCIKKNRDHGFERKKGLVYRKVWREEREDYKLYCNLKNKRDNFYLFFFG